MPEPIAKILFVGDIHLGRRPAGAAEQLVDHGLEPRRLGPARALELAVELALAEEVHAFVLAGDVIESPRDRFEAYAHLERATRRLLDAGVRVLGVAGNHDAIALPRLAQRLPRFELLGANGRWETRALQAPGGELLLAGYSFATSHHPENPFRHPSWAALRAELLGTTSPVLGVLHCDRDQGSSRYAPVTSSDLESSGTDAFFLGHIHQPDALTGPRPVGYLGSLVGLDPGETGRRGPWLVEVFGRGQVQATHRPLGPVRWEPLEVSVEGLGGAELEDQLHGRILSAFAEHARGLGPELGRGLEAVGCRVKLCGVTSEGTALARLVSDQARFVVTHEIEGVCYFLEKLVDATEPALDLERAATGRDPLAILAREVLELQAGGDAADALVTDLDRRLDEVVGRGWKDLFAEAPSPNAHALLTEAARRVLRELLDQRPTGQTHEVER